MIFLNIESLLGRIEEENVVMVYIKDDTADADITAMGNTLKGIDNVKEVEFVPKEDAWAEQLATMEEAQAKFFTEKYRNERDFIFSERDIANGKHKLELKLANAKKGFPEFFGYLRIYSEKK